MPVESVQKAIDLLEKGRAEQAIPLLEDVVDALPAYAGAFVLLARAYETGERWHKAQQAWQSALLLVPDSPVAAEGIRRALRQGRQPGKTVMSDPQAYSEVEHLHRSTSAPAPPQRAEQPETRESDFHDLDNLDRLIAQLEDARITARPDLDNVSPPDLDDDIEDMVSETLARIYAAQNQHEEAARVYDQLAAQNPDRQVYFKQKAREMRGRTANGGGEGT